MATLSGSLWFDRDRSATYTPGDAALPHIPMVLQNIDTGKRLAIVTDTDGSFQFLHVPSGRYRLVESYVTTTVLTSPGDFSFATEGPAPLAALPPVQAAPDAPPGATDLDAVTPSTLLLQVDGFDISHLHFFNGPVAYQPLDPLRNRYARLSTTNLLSEAGAGTFGFFAAGTPMSRGADPAPYPASLSDLQYALPAPAQAIPAPGQYTIQNLTGHTQKVTDGLWWRVADHSAGDETGRMLLVNSPPDTVWLRYTLAVQPRATYLFSFWMLPLLKGGSLEGLELTLRCLTPGGFCFYETVLRPSGPFVTGAPQWTQLGAVLDCGPHRQITVELLPRHFAAYGSVSITEYALDDFSLAAIQLSSLAPLSSRRRFF